MKPVKVWTFVDTSSVCVEFSAQLYVCGVVTGFPSTMTCRPGGFDVTVTCVGGAPYRRSIKAGQRHSGRNRLNSGSAIANKRKCRVLHERGVVVQRQVLNIVRNDVEVETRALNDV